MFKILKNFVLKSFLVSIPILIAFFLVIPSTYAKIGIEGEVPQVLLGCVKVSTGKVRAVDTHDLCLPSEQAVSFTINQTGRRCPIGESVTGYTSEGKMICSDGMLASIEIGDDCPENLVPGADITNCDLSDRNLTGLDLSNVVAKGTIFSNSILSGVNFSGADLEGAQFAGATMNATIFDNAKLDNTNIGANSSPTSASDASFVNASLKNTRLYLVGHHIDFSLADLTDTTFYLTGGEAILEAANLSNATLRFSGSGKHNFTGALLDDFVILSGTNCNHCNFSDTTGDVVRIYGGTASGSNMQSMTFAGANISNLSLYGNSNSYGNFNYTSFAGATLDNLYIYGNFLYCNFEGSELHMARINASVSYANFDSASLVEATLYSSSKFYDTSFVGADLANSRWYISYSYGGLYQLQGADFSGANLFDSYFYRTYINPAYEPIWNNTTCPDGSNSDDNGGMCNLY